MDKFSKIKTVYKGQPVTVNVDLKHIMNVEYSFAHDTDVSGYVLNLTGGHFPGSCKALEEVGLVKIKKIKVLNNGCEQYLIKNILTDQVYPKTEFLAGWDIAKIIELGLEVLEDTSAVDNAAKNRGILRAGVTKDGYKISIIFDQISEAEIDLITMWPR